MFVVNVAVLVHDVIASAYVKAVTSTGTEVKTRGHHFGFTFNTFVAFAKAEAYPTAPWRDATPGQYSGYASVSATVGGETEEDSGVIWVRIMQDGTVGSSSGGYAVKVTGDEDASTSAFASGHLYGI